MCLESVIFDGPNSNLWLKLLLFGLSEHLKPSSVLSNFVTHCVFVCFATTAYIQMGVWFFDTCRQSFVFFRNFVSVFFL